MKKIGIVFALVVLAFGGGVIAQAATGAVSFIPTRGHCMINADTSAMTCVIKRVSSGPNGGKAEDMVLTVQAAGGAIVDQSGRQVAAATPAGIISTCGACPGAIDTALPALCTPGNGKCDP